MRLRISDFLWPLGVGMLTGWLVLDLFLLAVLKAGGAVQIWHGGVWVAATFGGTWAATSGRKTGTGGRWVVAGILTGVGLALPVLFSWVLGHFTDLSWDGMTSRGITVRNLMFGQPALSPLSLGHVSGGFLAKLMDSWQAGKGINLTLLWISLCYTLGGLRALGFQKWRLITLGFLTVLNPVALYQISCFQIDGHLASLFTCMVFGALSAWKQPVGHPGVWLGLLVAFFGLTLAKTAGTFYGITVLFLLACFILSSSDLPKKSKKAICFLFLASMAGGLGAYHYLGLGLLSLDRLRQVSDIRTPSFGVGEGASKVQDYLHLSRPSIFAASAFSMTEVLPEEIRLKPPFAMTRRELRVFEELTPDPRAGGFGPQFSGAMLLAGLGCSALLVLRQPIYPPGLFLVLAATLSSYFSQLWWARWTPQNWLILIGMLMTLVHAGWSADQVRREQGTKFSGSGRIAKWIQLIAVLAVAATAFNVGLVALYYSVGMVRQENVLNRQIELAENLGKPIPIHLQPNHDGSYFLASELWFTERGLQVERLEAEPDRPRMKLNKTNTRFPLPQEWRRYLKDPKDEVLFRKRGCVED